MERAKLGRQFVDVEARVEEEEEEEEEEEIENGFLDEEGEDEIEGQMSKPGTGELFNKKNEKFILTYR